MATPIGPNMACTSAAFLGRGRGEFRSRKGESPGPKAVASRNGFVPRSYPTRAIPRGPAGHPPGDLAQATRNSASEGETPDTFWL
jgi:hypothetical protein